jgi:hypothetical protein
MNICEFCSKTIDNKGSLAAHIKCCKNNPNRVKNIRSQLAGQQKGCVPWNKGKTFDKIVSATVKQKIESGEYKKFSEFHIRTLIKKYLIQTKGHQCMMCGLSEWMGVRIPIVCDHIDGNSKNNDLSNFRIICNNCDSILPTFKGKNRGNGRKDRYE